MEEETLKVLELYSGIGGMHYALTASKIKAKVVAAVDINPHANLVYRHNFRDTLNMQKTIEGIKIEDYNRLDFDMILMSPPCQPFTRQGKQGGALDNRSQSFLYLIDLLPQLKKKPKYILMENVKGFDESTAHDDFINMLINLNYSIKEFLLSPIQFGIPNSRLRYFLIAKLRDTNTDNNYKTEIAPIIPEFAHEWIEAIYNELRAPGSETNETITNNSNNSSNVSSSKEGIVKEAQINNNFELCCQSEVSFMFQKKVRKLSEFIYNSLNNNNVELSLKDDAFEKNLQSADLVTEDATRTSCFTKNYGRYMEGTGSILIKSKENIQINNNESDTASSDCCKYVKISKENLRFLSPKEIANLHCFPTNFEYPDELTTIQKWRVIGNSLNVLIVSVLIKIMINMD